MGVDPDIDASFSTLTLIPTDDEAVVRRVKAVAATRPLHDLERNKASYDGDFWDGYDLLSLAVKAIDQVALAMGVSAGIPYDEAAAYLADQARRQRDDGTEEERRAVAERVLSALVTEIPHEITYADHGPDGVVRRVHDFRLLYEQWSADNTVHLRASEDAINVLVDALDIDVRSAQVAAEAQMRFLISRNAFAAAVGVARRERYRSIQLLEQVRTIVRDTIIDPDAYDWQVEVPELLRGALDHIVERIVAEGELAQAVEERRDATVDAELRRSANQFIAVLRECRSRHSELQRHLIGARDQLRRSQDDRFARPRGQIRRAALEGDLIEPLLSVGQGVGAVVGDGVLLRFAAPRRVMWPSLSVVIDELLEPPPPTDQGHDVPQPIFGEDPIPWWEPYWDAAEDIVAGISEPVLLSDLVAGARAVAVVTSDEDGNVLDGAALAGAVCHLVHGLLATPLKQGDGPDSARRRYAAGAASAARVPARRGTARCTLRPARPPS